MLERTRILEGEASVTSDSAGRCPKCEMKLLRARLVAETAAHHGHAADHGDDYEHGAGHGHVRVVYARRS